MVDEDLQAPMHDILSRAKWLKAHNLSCPKCKAPMRLIGIRLLPTWICDKCAKTVRYEPIKNVTPRSTFNNEEM